ncbi:MAG TPA: hypothetical protein VKR83_20920 [Ktedonobacteraceae bacterium]|nr:hypothetical protein [Ktedonobacteraceae bacterium]
MIDNDKCLLPAFEAPDHLEIYDIHNASYDVELGVTTLTGLLNRHKPRVYLLSNNDAETLFNALLAHVPHECINTSAANTLNAMLTKYRDIVKGMVIYDPTLLDSVNVATTLAGLRDAIVVSPQQATAFQQKPYQLPVIADLRIYHWKHRLQAYSWAQNNLLRESTRQLVAGMNPHLASGLRSFLVATRAFVYWLNPLNILPDPTGGWSSEYCLMKRILRAFPPGTPHLGWFVNEFAGVHLASKAALPTLPSDFFYNLEVWTAIHPIPVQGTGDPCGRPGDQSASSHPGNRSASSRPGEDNHDLANEQQTTPGVYVSFTISDGDNLQYDQHRMYQLWQDPARGSIPLGWTISPFLSRAAPTLADYYEQTATQNDELIAGASGAGYIWPSSWPTDQLATYLQLTGTQMQRMRLLTIEVLDGPLSRLFPFRPWQQQYAKLLSPFGVRGILSSDSYTRGGWRIVAGMPVIKNLGLAKSVAQALKLIKNNTPAQMQRPVFLNVYLYAWRMTPTDIKKVMQALDSRYKMVTPGQLCALIAQAQERG